MKSPDSDSTSYKPRIAFLGVGVGLPAEKGGGQGLPMMIALLTRLAPDFELVIYSLIRVNRSALPTGITVRQIPAGLPARVGYLLLIAWFVADHVRHGFVLLNAISAFPAGRIGIVLGRIFRLPVFVHLIGSETVMLPEIGYGDLLDPRLRKIAGWVCRKADVLIVQTEYQRKITQKNLNLEREVTVLSRRVDSKMFPFHERTLDKPVKFLHVASVHPVKDQDTLFEAFAQIARQVECHLTVIGDGFNDPRVQQKLSDLGIADCVTARGMVPHSEMPSYYDQAHIVLHSSRYESLCGTVQEAMAAGVPVCGTAVGILADLGSSFAEVTPPGNPTALAERAIALVHNEKRYREIQLRAHEYIIRHDAEWAAERYKTLFNKWLK